MRYLEIIFEQIPMDFLSSLHIMMIVAFVVIVGGIVFISILNPSHKNISLVRTLPIVSILFVVLKQIIIFLEGDYSTITSLPIQIIDLVALVMFVWAIRFKKTTSNFAYNIGMIMPILLVVFDVNRYPYFDAISILNLCIAINSFASFLVFVMNKEFAPRFCYLKYCVLTLALASGITYGIDYALGSNYFILDWFYKYTPLSNLGERIGEPQSWLVLFAMITLVWYIMVVFFERQSREEEKFEVSNEYLQRRERRIK